MRLAMRFPELLTYDESEIWKFIKESSVFWRPLRPTEDKKEHKEPIRIGVNLTLVRATWDVLMQIPAGVQPDQKQIRAVEDALKKEPGNTVVLSVNADDSFSVFVVERQVFQFVSKPKEDDNDKRSSKDSTGRGSALKARGI